MNYPRKPLARFFVLLCQVPLMCCVLGVVMVSQQFFATYIYRADCVAYAKAQRIDTAELTFAGVVVATQTFHGQICNFTDAQGYTVSVAYAPQDVSNGRATFYVLASMVCPAALCMWILSYPYKRLSQYLYDREQGV